MTLGYLLTPPDNKCRMYDDMVLNDCAIYRDIYSINKVNPTLRIKTDNNVSYTYDGFIVVSEKFKEFCTTLNYSYLEFVALPNSPGFYWFKVNNIIAYDVKARGTRFINFNHKCDGYEEIIGATPVYLKKKQILKKGFYRTDICFGSDAAKSPLYLIDETTMNKLLLAGFNEICFEKILDRYPSEQN